MVGRLVEQQEIGLHHEEPREMRAHDPAAAQGARRPREITLAKSEPGEDAFRFRLDLPVVLIFQCLVRLAAGELEDRFFAGRRGLLREVAERDIFLERDFARVGRCIHRE